MFNGQSEGTILKSISKGGNLYERYKNKNMIVGLLMVDFDKVRSRDLLLEYFNELHFLTENKLDMFLIGYRTQGERNDINAHYLQEIDKLNIENNDTIMYFDSELFHKTNNYYKSQKEYKKYINSGFYATFFSCYDGIPNLDRSYVVNFIQDNEEEDKKFMETFISLFRNELESGEVSIDFIEKYLDSKLLSNSMNRIFRIVRSGKELLLQMIK